MNNNLSKRINHNMFEIVFSNLDIIIISYRASFPWIDNNNVHVFLCCKHQVG